MSLDLAIESVQFRIGSTAAWRRGLAARYPDDPRNIRAAATLGYIARSDAKAVSPAVLAILAKNVESSALPEVVSNIARDVGFRRDPKDLDQFLALVVENLNPRTCH
jgi:hypothetical protein